MVELTDEQLLAELEDLPEDLELQSQGPEIGAQQQGENVVEHSAPVPAVPDMHAETTPAQASPRAACAASSPALATEEADLKAEAAADGSKPSNDPPAARCPAIPSKKRGLVAVAKKPATDASAAGSATIKPAAQPLLPRKKVVGRVVQDEEAEEPAPAAEEPATPIDNVALDPAKAKAAAGASKKGLPAKKPAVKGMAEPKKAAKAPAQATKKAAKQAQEDGGDKVKRARSAFIFFSSEMRAAVKTKDPSLSMGGISKKLGEMWKALSPKEKAPYEAQAQKDKQRANHERDEAKAATGVPAKPAAKGLFCDAKRAEVKGANPDAGFGALGTLLAAAWKEASEDDKAPFIAQHEELKAQLQAASPAVAAKAKRARHAQCVASAAKGAMAASEDSGPDGAETEEGSPEDDMSAAPAAAASAAPKKARAPAKKRARAAPASAPTGALATEEAQPEAEDDDDSIEQDMMNVDWEAHPAEYIVAETFHSKYLVKRKGLDFSACGLVDARAAKQQRMQPGCEPDQAPCPVSLPMMDEFDAFNRSFQCAVHAHTDSGELDLDDLNQESPLEMCSLMGIMREPHFPLSKVADKNKDVMIKVPMMGLSRAVQRVACVERKAAAANFEQLSAQAAELRAKNAELRMQLAAMAAGSATQLPSKLEGVQGKAGEVAGAATEE